MSEQHLLKLPALQKQLFPVDDAGIVLEKSMSSSASAQSADSTGEQQGCSRQIGGLSKLRPHPLDEKALTETDPGSAQIAMRCMMECSRMRLSRIPWVKRLSVAVDDVQPAAVDLSLIADPQSAQYISRSLGHRRSLCDRGRGRARGGVDRLVLPQIGVRAMN